MYEILFYHHQQLIYNDKMDFLPSISTDMQIDILDIHYDVMNVRYQPEQKRLKVFLEMV
jgi:hypothetical protein